MHSILENLSTKSNVVQSNDRIVGGFETTIEQNPWQISLRYYNRHRCGGSIIGKSWVLTAAHCTEGISTGPLSIWAGSANLTSGGTIIFVKQIHQHERYNPRILNNDFSLLELVEPFTFSDGIQPVALAAGNTIIKDGTNCLSKISGCTI